MPIRQLNWYWLSARSVNKKINKKKLDGHIRKKKLIQRHLLTK